MKKFFAIPLILFLASFNNFNAQRGKLDMAISTDFPVSCIQVSQDKKSIAIADDTEDPLGFQELLNKLLEQPITIIALCSLIISIIALFVSIIFTKSIIRHNKKSVQPIALIKFNDREDYISVDIRNVGIGPLIIKKLKVYKTNDKKGITKKRETKSNLIDWLPQHPDELSWSDFVEHMDIVTIPAGDKLFLIEMEFRDENHELEENFRQQLRNSLKGLTIEIDYEDIYKKKFVKKRSCDWFGRLLEE